MDFVFVKRISARARSPLHITTCSASAPTANEPNESASAIHFLRSTMAATPMFSQTMASVWLRLAVFWCCRCGLHKIQHRQFPRRQFASSFTACPTPNWTGSSLASSTTFFPRTVTDTSTTWNASLNWHQFCRQFFVKRRALNAFLVTRAFSALLPPGRYSRLLARFHLSQAFVRPLVSRHATCEVSLRASFSSRSASFAGMRTGLSSRFIWVSSASVAQAAQGPTS